MKVTDFIISILIFLSLFAIKINAIEPETDTLLAVSFNEQITPELFEFFEKYPNCKCFMYLVSSLDKEEQNFLIKIAKYSVETDDRCFHIPKDPKIIAEYSGILKAYRETTGAKISEQSKLYRDSCSVVESVSKYMSNKASDFSLKNIIKPFAANLAKQNQCISSGMKDLLKISIELRSLLFKKVSIIKQVCIELIDGICFKFKISTKVGQMQLLAYNKLFPCLQSNTNEFVKTIVGLRMGLGQVEKCRVPNSSNIVIESSPTIDVKPNLNTNLLPTNPPNIASIKQIGEIPENLNCKQTLSGKPEFQNFEKKIEMLAKNPEKSSEALKNIIKKSQSKELQMAKDAASGFLDSFKDLFSKDKNKDKKDDKKNSDFFKDLINKSTDNIKDMFNGLTDKANSGSTLFSEKANDVSKSFENIKKDLLDPSKKSSDGSSIFDSLKDISKNALDSVNNISTNVLDASKTILKDENSKISSDISLSNLNNLTKDTKIAVDLSIITEKMKNEKDKIKMNLENMQSKFANSIICAAEKIHFNKDGIPVILAKETLVPDFKQVLEKLKDSFGDKVTTDYNNLLELINNNSGYEQSCTPILPTFWQYFEIKNNSTDIIKNLINKVKETSSLNLDINTSTCLNFIYGCDKNDLNKLDCKCKFGNCGENISIVYENKENLSNFKKIGYQFIYLNCKLTVVSYQESKIISDVATPGNEMLSKKFEFLLDDMKHKSNTKICDRISECSYILNNAKMAFNSKKGCSGEQKEECDLLVDQRIQNNKLTDFISSQFPVDKNEFEDLKFASDLKFQNKFNNIFMKGLKVNSNIISDFPQISINNSANLELRFLEDMVTDLLDNDPTSSLTEEFYDFNAQITIDGSTELKAASLTSYESDIDKTSDKFNFSNLIKINFILLIIILTTLFE